MRNDERAHKKIPPNSAWPTSRDPTIIGIRSNISSKLFELVSSDFKSGKQLWLPGSAYYGLLWGSYTVGYPSDSLAPSPYRQARWTDFHVIWRSFAQGSAFWG